MTSPMLDGGQVLAGALACLPLLAAAALLVGPRKEASVNEAMAKARRGLRIGDYVSIHSGDRKYVGRVGIINDPVRLSSRTGLIMVPVELAEPDGPRTVYIESGDLELV